MFTGIITEIGKIKSLTRKGHCACLEVICEKSKKNISPGDSVAVNGVCLSVIKKNEKTLIFDAVKNTLNATNLKRLKIGNKVNLETALKMGDSVSGHMVSGHVDGERVLKRMNETGNGWVLEIALISGDEKYTREKGSIALDGVSLTIAEIYPSFARIFLIPYTLENTTLRSRRPGDYINVEFDMTAKYAPAGEKREIDITRDMLNAKFG